MRRYKTGIATFHATEYPYHTPCTVSATGIPQCSAPMLAALRHAKSRGFFRYRHTFPGHLATYVIRCRNKSYNPLFYKHFYWNNFASSEQDKAAGAFHQPTARRERRAAIRLQEDSLFPRTEQVVFRSDKKSFVRPKPACPPSRSGEFLQSRNSGRKNRKRKLQRK